MFNKVCMSVAALLFISCAEDGSDGSVLEPATEASAAQQVATPSGDETVNGLIIIMTYYSDPSLTTQVGVCTTRTCAPKGTRCTGMKSNYSVKEERQCN